MPAACVESSDDDQRLRFEAADSGIGIEPCEQTIVFEEYRQANASVAWYYGGIGLGLSICKGLAQVMGGTIGLVTQVGIGMTMFFEIPFQLPSTLKESAEREERTALLEGMERLRLRLLVVEDYKINQKLVRRYL